jgi:hypothetical protein
MKYFLSLLLLSCFIAANTDNLYSSDAVLSKFVSEISGDWNVTEKDSTLIIESKDTMYIDFYNSAGVPLNDPEANKYTEEYLKKKGKKTLARIEFRMEKKWSEEKIKATKAKNKLVQEKIDGLKGKYKLTEINSSMRYNQEVFLGTTKKEEKRITKYKKEKEELEQSKIKIPVYNTENFSLIKISNNWQIGDSYHMLPQIYPRSEWTKILALEQKISDELVKD